MATDAPTAQASENQETQEEAPEDTTPRARDLRAGWATVDKTVFGLSFGIIMLITVLGMVFTGIVGSAASEPLR